jgi:NAD-dependent SIR2 family protein deacetylase
MQRDVQKTLAGIQATQAKADKVQSESRAVLKRWDQVDTSFKELGEMLAIKFGGMMGDANNAEKVDTVEQVQMNAYQVAQLIREAEGRVCVFTGAGISTACGIQDYRSGLDTASPAGPGARTLEEEHNHPAPKPIRSTRLGPVFEERPVQRVQRIDRFEDAAPSFTHSALALLQKKGMISHVISQNIDGLHRRSGLPPEALSELHGNAFVELCYNCGTETKPREYERSYAVYHKTLDAVGSRTFLSNATCTAGCAERYRDRCHCTMRACDGCGNNLLHSIVHFGENLNPEVVKKATTAAKEAKLCIVLGSSCSVSPAADLPRVVHGNGGSIVVVNLQHTPLDHLCKGRGVRIHAACDDVMDCILHELSLAPETSILKAT